ncbi:MAG: SpoIIE family protein phosphatase, partial [Salinivirgaceae bacterium]|nr:SpoIIE family protein phosphatase [Salinivirgaceae bacterium]
KADRRAAFAAATEKKDRSQDGMDVAAYVVNEKQMTLSFAGANNPLILIRDNEVQIIKPDRMPVGISIMMKPFNTVTVELRKGDCLYTYSDGFQDQFGYNKDRKFQKSRLRNLLLEIHTRPMSEQRELLNLVFKEWRGPAENQTDDVVIMGVRI